MGSGGLISSLMQTMTRRIANDLVTTLYGMTSSTVITCGSFTLSLFLLVAGVLANLCKIVMTAVYYRATKAAESGGCDAFPAATSRCRSSCKTRENTLVW